MTKFRFRLGRWLMRLALKVMPGGPSRDDLAKVFKSWSRHVLAAEGRAA